MIPILYENTFVSIETVWIFVVLALFISGHLAKRRLKRRRVNFNLFIEHAFSFLLISMLVSRTIYFFTSWNAYFPRLDWRTVQNFFSIWDQGFSLWGAIIGFVIFLTYRIRKSGEEIWKWYDALIVPLFIGVIIGEVGAFLGGSDYGTPTNLPWGVEYQSFNVRYTVPIHPTQIYTALALGGILWSKFKLKKKFDFFQTDGNTTLYLVTLGSLASFLLEFVKGDDTLLILGVRMQMIAFALLFLLSGIALIKRYKAHKNEPLQTPES